MRCHIPCALVKIWVEETQWKCGAHSELHRSMFSFSHIKIESHHDANFSINTWWHRQLWQSWHHDNWWISVFKSVTSQSFIMSWQFLMCGERSISWKKILKRPGWAVNVPLRPINCWLLMAECTKWRESTQRDGSSRVIVMKTSWQGNAFSMTDPLCGNPTITSWSIHTGTVMWSLDVSVNNWLNSRIAGDLRRSYDVTLMIAMDVCCLWSIVWWNIITFMNGTMLDYCQLSAVK